MRTITAFIVSAAGFWFWYRGFDLLVTAGCVLAVLVMLGVHALIPRAELPRNRVRHHRLRLKLRLHPGRGHATAFALWLRWGRLASYRGSSRTRPSLTRWERIRHAQGYAMCIGRAHYLHRLWVDLQTHILILSPPRWGKTALLARLILHWPGAVVSTTTKADVFTLTSGIRERCSGPVHVFNPQFIGAVPSTFRWNPLQGCQDPATAIRRADAFANAVSQRGVEDGTFWSAKASDWMRALFMAAAFSGRSMLTVAEWGLNGNAGEAESILYNMGQPQAAKVLSEMRGNANKTAQTIAMSVARALSFLNDPALAAAVLPAEGDGLDIEQFLMDRGTLYMIAEARGADSPVAPLFACLANEIHYQAALLGSRMNGGRLDPPLLMALDEITQVCPLPLPSLLADSGGKGICIIPVCHGEAQMRTRWDHNGARVIQDTCGVKLLLPGVTDPDTLKAASIICGQAVYRERGDEKHSRHAVMTEDMISQLPAGWGLVMKGGYAPVVAKTGAAWKDREYKRAKRQGWAVAAITPAAVRPAIGGPGGPDSGSGGLGVPLPRRPLPPLPTAPATLPEPAVEEADAMEAEAGELEPARSARPRKVQPWTPQGREDGWRQ
jgi:hypothetical protein